MSRILQRYAILIADADPQLGKVLKSMLEEMGFSNVFFTQSGHKAIELLQQIQFDFLITEWNVQHLPGIEVIKRVRHGALTTNPALPIIMLTGRAEHADVLKARDLGINEYVIKPFNARTIYERLERLVEKPRPFVVSEHFIGPDRRYKSTPPEGIVNRRKAKITPQRKPAETSKDLNSRDIPKVWAADYSLKQKLGVETSLSSLITPAVLNLAQSAIDSISVESLQWIRQNLADIRSLQSEMTPEKNMAMVAAAMGEIALTISSRAGTFGYSNAAEVAYMLYLFCTSQFNPELPIHRTIAEKHIDVLQVTLGDNVRDLSSPKSREIINELRNLVEKYAA